MDAPEIYYVKTSDHVYAPTSRGAGPIDVAIRFNSNETNVDRPAGARGAWRARFATLTPDSKPLETTPTVSPRQPSSIEN